MMKYLQKLGKALMLPVAVLPICGILMGLGYAFAPGVMGVPGAATSGIISAILSSAPIFVICTIRGLSEGLPFAA